MDKLTRWLPRLIVATAVLHFAVGLLLQETFGDVLDDGLWNAVEGDSARESDFWFMEFGVLALALGGMAAWSVRETGRVPASLGACLLVAGVPMAVVMPASGGWLLILLALLALRAARKPARSLPAMEPSRPPSEPAKATSADARGAAPAGSRPASAATATATADDDAVAA